MTSIEELRRIRRETRNAVPRVPRRDTPILRAPAETPVAPRVSTMTKKELVGTELKALLQHFGVSPSEGCQCNNIAAEMDYRGAAWCEQHLDRLAGRMTQEAWRRQWPLLQLTSVLGLGSVTEVVARQAARWLIMEAIRRSRTGDDLTSLSGGEGKGP